MNQKALVVILVIIIVVGGIAFVMTRTAPSAVAPTQQTAVTSTDTVVTTTTTTAASYNWKLTDVGDDPETGVGRTQVALVANGTAHDLGTFKGSCAISERGQLLANEKTAVVCWFAGGGDELGVFEEGGKIVVKQGIQDEGTPEDGGFRGDFKTVLVL